jgi:circadian clock protein KaiC
MTDKVQINRLATGVPGLDEVLGGGLPELSFNLIAGQPGCGKTTLAHQMMFALATPDRPALYITVLGEPPLKMLRYQQQFQFFDAARINESVHFVNLADETLTGDLEVVLKRIVAEVAQHEPALVFVDSFRSVMLATAAGGNNDLQKFIQELGMLMTSWQATTFLIGEYSTETDDNPIFTVADGLIWLRQSVQRNSMVRKMEILKMRGQATLPGLHTFRINSAGVEIFPPAGLMTSQTIAAPCPAGNRILTGVARLDEMLGGGLPRGYSVLIAGPSGSGKSILAAEFLAEGARCGETGVIAAFEQRPDRARNAIVDQLIKEGRVGLVDARVPDLSMDEVLKLLLVEIRRLKASRVVLDSLSGFELALAPAFREDFREQLALLVAGLTAAGVTALMTSELEDRYNDLRFSPYGTAFLTDAIIVQRYIELDSRLRRVMAVVKVRACTHSNELREYTIDGNGIQVGEMLPHHEGLLGGRPTKKHLSPPDDVANDSGPRASGRSP